jgi:outer membrane protein OmpA-like peptidoglycan-associated protein
MHSSRIPFALVVIFALFLTAVPAVAQEPDFEGSKDHPLLTRMPGFFIYRYTDAEFDRHEFFVKGKPVPVEGHLYTIQYNLQPGVKAPSRLQVLNNYENAIKKIGGTVLGRDDEGSSYLKVVKNGREVWVHVAYNIAEQYFVYILEKGEMAQDVVADAAALLGEINATGKAAVYGIYFDTGKSVVKPESDGALVQIAGLLKANPALKVYIVGHTDSVGETAANMKLSQARAEAAVQALVSKHGAEAGRLKGYGVGPLSPAASNDTDEGKAKNRRVEVVKQ